MRVRWAARRRCLRSAAHALLWPGPLTITVVALLATTLFWALRSPVSLALLTVLGSRAIGANASYWGLPHHHNLLPAVVLGFATLDALRRHRPGRRSVRLLVGAAPVAALAGPLIPRMLAHETPQRLACASRLMTAVPEGDGVAATALLTPQLTHHHPVTQRVRPVHENGATSFPDDQGLPLQAPWVLLDHGAPRSPGEADWVPEAERQFRSRGFQVVARCADYELLHRT